MGQRWIRPAPTGKVIERLHLVENGLRFCEGDDADRELMELRLLCEPYVHALASHFHVAIPPWIAGESLLDNWQHSAWEQRGRGMKAAGKGGIGHF